MRTFVAILVALSISGAAYAESVPSKLMDQVGGVTSRTERAAVDAASEGATRAQREATERANREMIERQNREAFERTQREASERSQREARARTAADQQSRALEQARVQQLETSRAARLEAMRQAGAPTSQQPVSQGTTASGRHYTYETPAPGGGTQQMGVQQQTLDRSHLGQPHWEAGRIKSGGQVNQYGVPRLDNDKSKVNY